MLRVYADALWFCRKEGWTRMDTCNVRIMDGPLPDADLVLGFLKLLLQVLKLVLLNPLELALLSSQQWYLKVFSLCGLMKMAGTEPIQLSPLGNERNDYLLGFSTVNIEYLFYCQTLIKKKLCLLTF